MGRLGFLKIAVAICLPGVLLGCPVTNPDWGTGPIRVSAKRLIAGLIGCATILLSACVATIDSAKEAGGIQLGAMQIRNEVSGLTAKAEFMQGYVAEHTFTFGTDGELMVDSHRDGRWHTNNEGRLCLEWPSTLAWTHPGFCFVVVKQGRVLGFYDYIVNQERIRITRG